uniref:NmrA-like domain-containing protein n=1 Tax=Chaetoceros debilis TaxID=122233 RepID=A0A7S3VCV3_9STRA
MGIFGKSKKKKGAAASRTTKEPAADVDVDVDVGADADASVAASNIGSIMSTSTVTPTYLVIGATGRQGRATINALIAKGITSIVGSTRNPASAKAKELVDLEEVTKIVKADMSDVASLVAAIRESRANHIWFMAPYWDLPYLSRNRAGMAKLGQNVIDAIVLVQERSSRNHIEHVVFSSVASCDSAPDAIGHFKGNLDTEMYMKEQLTESNGDTDDSPANDMTWVVLRPVAFFDNVDDAANYNTLNKGNVKMLTKEETSCQYISIVDVGKASAVLLTEPGTYKGKTIEAVADKCNGTDLATALTEASGMECTFSMAMPRMALRLMDSDLYQMVTWFEETGGYTADIEEFKKIVPDAMDAKAWFESKGKWANGELFDSNKPKEVEETSKANTEVKSEVETN